MRANTAVLKWGYPMRANTATRFLSEGCAICLHVGVEIGPAATGPIFPPRKRRCLV